MFDTNFTADLTIIEEGTELILRLYKALVLKEETALPQFTSCSPGWVKFIEHFYPEMLAHMSSAKSPQQMFGAVIKTYYAKLNNIDPANIVTVALMPCSAKKFECNRPEMCDSGFKDIDYGLTTRELAQMIKEAGIDLPRMPKSEFDDPFGTATGSGVIFGATGGVMEAALRTVIELVTGLKVENLFDHMPTSSRCAVSRGSATRRSPSPRSRRSSPRSSSSTTTCRFPTGSGSRARRSRWPWPTAPPTPSGCSKNIKEGGKFSECHFIEFMACPGGCLGGGGQPIPTSPEIRAARARAIYAEDESYTIRKSHENPAVVKLYTEFLTDGPCGHTSHHLLHTHYTPRGKYIG